LKFTLEVGEKKRPLKEERTRGKRKKGKRDTAAEPRKKKKRVETRTVNFRDTRRQRKGGHKGRKRELIGINSTSTAKLWRKVYPREIGVGEKRRTQKKRARKKGSGMPLHPLQKF